MGGRAGAAGCLTTTRIGELREMAPARHGQKRSRTGVALGATCALGAAAAYAWCAAPLPGMLRWRLGSICAASVPQQLRSRASQHERFLLCFGDLSASTRNTQQCRLLRSSSTCISVIQACEVARKALLRSF